MPNVVPAAHVDIADCPAHIPMKSEPVIFVPVINGPVADEIITGSPLIEILPPEIDSVANERN